MTLFSTFKSLKENAQTTLIKGPGVDALKSTFVYMHRLGAPIEKNDIGFNGTHFTPAVNLIHSDEFHQDGLSVTTIQRMLAMLNVYKNTQIRNYPQIKAEVEKEIAAQAPAHAGPKATAEGKESITVYKNIMNYGKFKAVVSEIPNNWVKGQINKLVGKECEAIGSPKEVNQWGKEEYFWKDKIKFYNVDKENARIVWINPKILDEVLEIFKNKNYEVSVTGEEQKGSEPDKQDNKPKEDNKPRAKVIRVDKTRIIFSHNLGYDSWNEIRLDLIKRGIWNSALRFSKDDSDKPEYTLDLMNPKFREAVGVLMNKMDMADVVAAVGTAIEQQNSPEGAAQQGTKDDISFRDVPNTKNIKIRFERFINAKEFQHLKEMIIYTFPTIHQYDNVSKMWTIGGSYQQFISFGRLLKNYNYNVDGLRDIIKEKTKRGELTREAVEGDVPDAQWNVVEKATEKVIKSFKEEKAAEQFLNGMPDKQNHKIEHIPHFRDMINDLLPHKNIELYEAQKEGIEFLFHRKTAILGDETGLGKTVQLIGAAEIKMQEDDYHKPTLIIALNKITVKQWAEEVARMIGKEHKGEISIDPHDPKRWTILDYDMFSHKEKGMETETTPGADGAESTEIKGCIDKLIHAKFGIVILDELHKIKSGKTIRWGRLTRICQNIPVRWGATATISANNAMDVKNQLLIINHDLGKLADGKFKKDFAGMELKDTPVGKRYVQGSEESRLEAAERLNKWLHLSGVYLRRKKSDVRDMPNLHVGRDDIGIDVSKYQSKVNERYKKYKDNATGAGKDPSEATHLKEMIAQRTELATAKVPETLKITANLLREGKRVIVFTAFKESAEELKVGLSRILSQINPHYKMLTYISSTPKKERVVVKDKFNKEEDNRVLLMSLKMGSTGVDFPNAASEMVINDYDWTPEQAEQSEGRIYRINTTQNVHIHYVIAKGTYDESLYDIVQLKRRVARMIQETREEYRKEKDINKSEVILKKLVDLNKQIISADAEIKKIENDEIKKVAPDGATFKEFVLSFPFER